jgi:hypothetical protein
MEHWAKTPQSRRQMVLFVSRLDEVIAADSSAGLGERVVAWAVGADSVESGLGRGARGAAGLSVVGGRAKHQSRDVERVPQAAIRRRWRTYSFKRAWWLVSWCWLG